MKRANAKAQESLSPLPALWDYLTLSLLGMVFFPILILTASLLLKIGAERWLAAFAGGALSPLLCYPLIRRERPSQRLIAWSLLVCVLTGSAFLCVLIYDQSYDGLVYHSDAILSLLRGANPAYRDMGGRFPFWTNHYPKATWVFAAVITHVTGNFQLGKILNFLLIAGVFAYGMSYARRRGCTRAASPLIAAAFAFSPVALNQLFSFYVDGALSGAFTLTLLSVLALLYRPRTTDRLVFIASACILLNLKFTGLAYLLAIMAAGGVCMLCYHVKNIPLRSPFKHALYDGVLIFLVGIVIMGFNPYITNTLVDGNPMYPLLGRDKTDVVISQTPAVFKQYDYSGPHKLIDSLFSKTENFCDGRTCDPAFKIPFSFTDEEITLFGNVDIRIGAWGVLFSGLLSAGAALYVASRGWKDAESTLALCMIALTLLINPHAWWARYAPQAGLLPLFLALPALIKPAGKARLAATGLFLLALVNASLILFAHGLYFVKETQKLQAQISHILDTCGPGDYVIGGTPFHYEQFLAPVGIALTYAPHATESDFKTQGWLPLGEGHVRKDGCR